MPAAQPVVDVVIVVGDVVGDRRDLRFEARPAVKLERETPHRPRPSPSSGSVDRPIMLGEPLERFPAQIEPVEIGIGIFERGHEPQRVGVVIEPAGIGERRGQRVLAAMAERRMAKVVREAQGLGQILVEPEDARHRPPDLRDLDRVGQADAEMVAVGGDEHLRLVAQAAEGDRMDDAVAVALEGVALPARAAVDPPRRPCRAIVKGARQGRAEGVIWGEVSRSSGWPGCASS